MLLDAGGDAWTPCAGFHFFSPLQLASVGKNLRFLRAMIGLPEARGKNGLGALPERCNVAENIDILFTCIKRQTPFYVIRKTKQHNIGVQHAAKVSNNPTQCPESLC